MLKIILFLFLLINCNDNNSTRIDHIAKNIPLNDLSILIPNRFKERITRWYEDRTPAVIRTYDIMKNELIKELRYFKNGTLMHEAIYSKGVLEPHNSVIWWHSNGNRLSQLVVDNSLKMHQGNIWYDNGQIRFHFEENNYYWWDREGGLKAKGNLNDTSYVLPVWSNSGRFVGTRRLIKKSKPLWVEEWTLFDNAYDPLIKGNVLCIKRDNEFVDRVINEEWVLIDSAGELNHLQLSAQKLLNTSITENNFITGTNWILKNEEYKNSLLDSNNSFRVNSEKQHYKSRQFNQNYFLILNSDGTFDYTCQDNYTDSGYYWLENSGEKLFLHYESGIYSGENHMIEIINHRKVFYQFRNSYYFLMPLHAQINANI